VVAVARKLAVLLHRLWVSGEGYEPLQKECGWKGGDRGGLAEREKEKLGREKL
jgi:hypothetical protein